MRILMASAEMAPYMKVGGLADVLGALPQELVRRGHTVAVGLPLYEGLDPAQRDDLEELEAFGIEVRFGDEDVRARIVRARAAGDVELLLVDRPELMRRTNPYVDPATGMEWPDSAQRFIFFCRALEEALRRALWPADVVHLHDHQTAPLASRIARGPGLGPSRPGLVFTIHNVGYQGVYDLDMIPLLDLPPSLWEGGPLGFWGKVNFLKMGIVDGDILTTVSEHYAREIASSAEYGCGLEHDLARRGDDLAGIVNGIDTATWNPATDELIPYPYRPSDFQNKRLNKERLLQSFELPVELDAPLAGIVSRLVTQKGFDLIEEAAGRLLGELGLRLVVLGTGEPRFEDLMRRLRGQYPEQIGVSIGFSEPLAHLVEAGSDFFLMPSRYEPCGLNQIYSFRYGTVPIVRATGGLADTVEEFEPVSGRGNGFVFHDYTAEAMLGAVARALEVYAKPRTFKKLIAKIMQLDFSWARTAGRFEEVYARA
ncbi:MAG: glycosyltransferase, partial [Candidatus Eisenbacteria bacterium]|nr:glycosyltransferase [Candidatus Eisenbacteria bacterium]